MPQCVIHRQDSSAYATAARTVRTAVDTYHDTGCERVDYSFICGLLCHHPAPTSPAHTRQLRFSTVVVVVVVVVGATPRLIPTAAAGAHLDSSSGEGFRRRRHGRGGSDVRGGAAPRGSLPQRRGGESRAAALNRAD